MGAEDVRVALGANFSAMLYLGGNDTCLDGTSLPESISLSTYLRMAAVGHGNRELFTTRFR